MPIKQTITVVNKSGKIVKSSKHLVNVFKEAQSAYREKKAELKAVRQAEWDEKQARNKLDDLTIDDGDISRSSSPGSRESSRRRSRRAKAERPPVERGYSDSFTANDHNPDSRSNGRSYLRHEVLFGEVESDHPQELQRRNTDGMLRQHAESRPRSARSSSMSDIDMDLAYGELPPPLPPRRRDEEMELRGQMTKLQQLLEEAHCLQYSATAIVKSLEANPDQMAAVALTLAEISSLASKMAPGALTALKGAFPVVIALLASPQFMIAAGVGVGVTIIAFGSYKIIKKIQRRKEVAGLPEPQSEYDELQEINQDISRIESWRRGIADAQASGVGTSVEGEFVTPGAGRQLIQEGRLRESDLKSTKSKKSKKKPSKTFDEHERSRASKPDKVKKPSKTFDEDERSRSSKNDMALVKQKEPSGLKMLFKSSTKKQQERELEPQLL
ncbi:hypothetical protein MBLNU457_4294t1 [Dothideomycetes sp. NU457]